jgi:predicted esterase
MYSNNFFLKGIACLFQLLLIGCLSSCGGTNTAELETDPVIFMKGSAVVVHTIDTPYLDDSATAFDLEDGDLSARIVTNGLEDVDTSRSGDYLIRYNVSDSDSRSAMESVRIVRVHNAGFVEKTPRPLGSTSSQLGYFEKLPQSYGDAPGEVYPLIIYLHGSGEIGEDLALLDGTYNENRDLTKLLMSKPPGHAEEFVVLFPQSTKPISANDSSEEDLWEFIRYATVTYKVDVSRVYVTGFSMGAFQLWSYLLRHQDQIAAAVPISGGLLLPGSDVCVFEEVPVWGFHSIDDPLIDETSTRNVIDTLRGCKKYIGDETSKTWPRLTIFTTGGHTIDDDVLDRSVDIPEVTNSSDHFDNDIYGWLLSHSRIP